MKKTLLAVALITSSFGVAAATGYTSSDAKYAKPCVTEAKEKALTMLKTYATMGEWDFGDTLNPQVTFPNAFKNPSYPQQYIHPIEFTALVSRGSETRIRVMYANSSATDPSLCVFMGIEFLDLTSAS